MSINEALKWGAKKLDYSCSPSLDAEVLLLHVLNPVARPFMGIKADKSARYNTAFLYANPEKKLTKLQATSYKLLIAKRSKGWPVAYLVGHKEFFGLDFLVTTDVLIPRPETELLVELALQKLRTPPFSPSLPAHEAQVEGIKEGGGGSSVIDLGTGSGNIIVSLVKTLLNKPFSPGEGRSWKRGRTNDLKFFAVDSSDKALIIAKLNARRHGVARKIKFLRGHLLSPFFSPTRRGRFPPGSFSPCLPQGDRGRLRGGRTLVIANLPYGWKQWKNNTSAETMGLKFEPRQALFTKEQGLYHIRKLFHQLKKFPTSDLRPPTSVLVEHDPRQKPALTHLVKKYFPRARLTFHKDLSNRSRVMEMQI